MLIPQSRNFESTHANAYNTLAELMHYLRSKITLDQVSKVVHVFSKNLHDSSLNFQLELVSTRLILTVANDVANKRTSDQKEYRALAWLGTVLK